MLLQVGYCFLVALGRNPSEPRVVNNVRIDVEENNINYNFKVVLLIRIIKLYYIGALSENLNVEF